MRSTAGVHLASPGGEGGCAPIYRASGLPTPGDVGGGGDSEEDGDTPDPPTMACPECGAENDPEFTYCRDCVAELPGSDLFEAVDGGDDAGLL